jgi:hypothetical protein
LEGGAAEPARNFCDNLLGKGTRISKRGADGFERRARIIFSRSVPSWDDEHGFARRVQTPATGAADSLPDAVRRERAEIIAVERLHVVKHDLANRQVDPHFESCGGNKHVELVVAKVPFDFAARHVVETSMVVACPYILGLEKTTQLFSATPALDEDQTLPTNSHITTNFGGEQSGFIQGTSITGEAPL